MSHNSDNENSVNDKAKKRGFSGGGRCHWGRVCTECGHKYFPGGWGLGAGSVTCSLLCSRRRKTRLQKERREGKKGAGSLPQ